MSALPLAAAILVTACSERSRTDDKGIAQVSCGDGARDVVERLGTRLKNVSLLAPDSGVQRAIREEYGPLVTPELLSAWLATPAQAPGRDVSSPWPERIVVDSVIATGENECRVLGHVVYLTSASDTADSALRLPVTLDVRANSDSRVSAYAVAPASPADSSTVSAAVDVLRQYYAALSARDFRRAYELWSNTGAASGQTFEQFAAGFDGTARVTAEIGTPGRMDAAAGSRYVKVPIVIRATTTGGMEQRFAGTYVLRRGVVDGATPEQRSWRIFSADIVRRP